MQSPMWPEALKSGIRIFYNMYVHTNIKCSISFHFTKIECRRKIWIKEKIAKNYFATLESSGHVVCRVVIVTFMCPSAELTWVLTQG